MNYRFLFKNQKDFEPLLKIAKNISTANKVMILDIIDSEVTTTVSEIAMIAKLNQGSTSRIVAELERNGAIRKNKGNLGNTIYISIETNFKQDLHKCMRNIEKYENRED